MHVQFDRIWGSSPLPRCPDGHAPSLRPARIKWVSEGCQPGAVVNSTAQTAPCCPRMLRRKRSSAAQAGILDRRCQCRGTWTADLFNVVKYGMSKLPSRVFGFHQGKGRLAHFLSHFLLGLHNFLQDLPEPAVQNLTSALPHFRTVLRYGYFCPNYRQHNPIGEQTEHGHPLTRDLTVRSERQLSSSKGHDPSLRRFAGLSSHLEQWW